MIEKLALPEIRELIEAKDFATLGEVLNRWLPADLAALIGRLPDADDVPVIRALRGSIASDVFEYLELAVQERLLRSLSDDESARILDGMSPDDRTALLEELAPDLAERFLDLMSPAQRAIARSLLQHGKETVGRLMTPVFLAVRREWTIKRVLEHIRTHGKASEWHDMIYVVDDENKLVNELRSYSLLLAPLHTYVRDLPAGPLVALSLIDDKSKAVSVFRKYDRNVLPVVDARGRLEGIVTIDDVLDVAEEQATREIQRFGGLEALDEPYASTPLLTMVKKRASWLVLLFLGETLTATAMGGFKNEIEKAVVLSLFVPLIISSGGNSGSQAATLIIRALALGEVVLRDWWQVMRREIASGLLLGALLGAIGFLRIALWSQFSELYGSYWIRIGLTVAISLVGVVMWGTLSGAMLPFLLKRLGFDPATSSAPFVATLVDVTGLIIYFMVARLVLRGALL